MHCQTCKQRMNMQCRPIASIIIFASFLFFGFPFPPSLFHQFSHLTRSHHLIFLQSLFGIYIFFRLPFYLLIILVKEDSRKIKFSCFTKCEDYFDMKRAIQMLQQQIRFICFNNFRFFIS
jgi:hypothetical protein